MNSSSCILTTHRRTVLRGLAALPVLPLATAASSASAAPSAQALLAASDAVRNPDFPFGLTNTLTEYRNGLGWYLQLSAAGCASSPRHATPAS